MASLILQRRFTQQPQYPVGIDNRNSLSTGLCQLWTPNSSLLIQARGGLLTQTGTITQSVSQYGKYAALAVNGALLGPANTSVIKTSDGAGTGDFTTLVWHRTAAVAVQIRTLVSQRSDPIPYNQFTIQANANDAGEPVSGSVQFSTYDTAYTSVAVAGAIDGNWHIHAMVRSGTSIYGYADGRKIATTSGTVRDVSVSTSQFGIGIAPSVYNTNPATDIVFVASWDRALSDAEIAEVSKNPWQLLRRSPQVLYFDTAAGGATHGSSGALTADSAVISGSSAHIALHPSSGALTAQSATTAGTALHSIPHASSGALDAQSATVAGTSAHITMHPSSGALSAQDAVIDGTADHTVPGVVTHYSSGALTAQDAVIAGTATHIVNHQSSGALASGDATVSGASIHNLTHATSGDLVAENATISGSYQGGTAVVSQASGGSSSQGRQSRNRKQRLILIDTIEEVEDLLDQVDEVIKEEPKKKKINWKKAKPAPDFGTEPQDVINRLDFYTAQLDQLRDQNRAKELKQQLEQNAAIYRQLLVKRASDAMILANNAKIREEEDIMLLLMAA